MSGYIFNSRELTKKYGTCEALKDVSFSISEGEIFGLIGENGAGKTTLMKIIAGSTNATSGEMIIMGASGREIQEKRKKMGVIIETPSCYGDMTGSENLEIIRLAKGIQERSAVDDALEIVGLLEVKNKKAGKYSLGMRQRLGLAMALMGSPKFLMLDEPINGLDPNGIIDIRNIIYRLNKEKSITILISSHILTELSQVATRYGIIHKGRLIALHSASELQDKCHKHVTILHEDKTEVIVNFLKRYNAEIIFVDEHIIKLKYTEVLPPNLLTLLTKENYIINEYYSQQESLEEYFVRLTRNGGVADV